MKKLVLLLILISTSSLVSPAFSQLQTKKIVYSVGVGFGNENNISNYGLYFTNDLNIPVSDKIRFTPRISFFQSVGSVEDIQGTGYRNHSGLFLDAGLSYYLFQNKNTGFSINTGPTFEIGSETYNSMTRFENGIVVEERFEHNKLRRLGLFLDVEFHWTGNSSRINTIGIKSASFGIFPEFLGIAYKLGLQK